MYRARRSNNAMHVLLRSRDGKLDSADKTLNFYLNIRQDGETKGDFHEGTADAYCNGSGDDDG